MSEKGLRGVLGVLADLLNWLRIYRQRDFWIQVATTIVGVFLWVAILPGEEFIGAIAAAPTLIFLNFAMTNIVWAISRKPYSCVLGGVVGYALYNFAVGVLVHRLSLLGIIGAIFLGTIYGFVFTSFALMIFFFLGFVKPSDKNKSRTKEKTKK